MSQTVPRGVVPIPSEHELELSMEDSDIVDTQRKILAIHTGTDGKNSVLSTKSQIQLASQPYIRASTDNARHTELAAIPVLKKKQSCKFTNVVSTCVNKASAHLELLQTLIEEWFAIQNTEICSGHSASSKGSSTRKVALYGSPVSTQPKGLAITGMGMKGPVETHTIADELPYLGGMEVIEEVYNLISRLEKDRVETEHLLFNEKQKGRTLQRKIDDLAYKRAIEFPLAVQAEHDAAVEDLNELNWHVTYKLRIEEKLRERVENANVFNERLTEDINFVQKHCPLVEEKLSLELNAMQKINEAQSDTDGELELTLERLAKTKVRNEEAHAKAEKERENMAKEIEGVQQELQNALAELADSRMLYSTYTHQTTEARKQIQENIDEKRVLVVKCENAKAAETMKNKKLDELTNKLRMIDSEHHKLEEEAFKKRQEYEVTKNTMESQFVELQKACDYEEAELEKLNRRNENLLVEIDNLQRKIEKAEEGILEDERTLRRISNQINNTESMMNQMLDEYTKVQIIHSAIRDKLQEEKERISQIEDALRQTLETLKKQCKDEIHTRGVLSSRITSDGAELVKSQVEAKQKKETLAKTVVEIEEQLKVVVEKVDKLRDVYNAKKQIYDELEGEIREIRETKAKIESEFVETKKEMDPYLLKLKDENSDLRQQILKLNNQMEMMARKKDEMDHSTKILEKSIRQNEMAVERLKKDFSEYNIQLDDQTMLQGNLLSLKDDVVRRIENSQKEHSQLMAERSITIKKHTETLQAELAVNRGLAQTYRKLQGEYVDLKSKVMDMFDERNRLEAGIKDLKQLKGLQSRMHKALETYYKFRGLFNSGELERVQAESRISARKVARLQDNYTSILDTITGYLNNQMKVLNRREVVQTYNSIAVGGSKSSSQLDITA